MASIRKLSGKLGDSYKITVTTGRDTQGRQIRHYKTWKPDRPMSARQTEKELQRVAFEFEQEIMKGWRADDRQTFGEYAAYYLELKKPEYKPMTYDRVKRFIARINEHIGHMKLRDIRPQHINAIYKDMAQPGTNRRVTSAVPLVDFKAFTDEEGGAAFARRCGISMTVIKKLRSGKNCSMEIAERIAKATGRKDLFRYVDPDKSLTPATIRAYHDTLCGIFEQANREMILTYNPVERAQPPKNQRSTKPKHLQPEQLQAFIEALKWEPLRSRVLFTLYAVTGCRRGEIIGLKWSKVDFLNRCITIDSSLNYLPDLGIYEGSTKTCNVRKIALSNDIVRLLLTYRKWQDGERLKWGDQWEGTDYVFTNQKGGAIHANMINYMLLEICNRHGLPPIHPHMLRHTAASIMIANGVDVLTVSKTLGHADTSTTLDIYGHEIEETKKQAIECLTDVILSKKA